MDPDIALESLRRDVKDVLDGKCSEDDLLAMTYDMAECFEDLDKWLSDGGFLPRDWRAGRER